jgi:phosphoribosylformylglycinamidine cyclo-ligase
VEKDEMFQVFNMGIGLVIAIPRKEAQSAVEKLKAWGEKPTVIGEIVAGKTREVIYND